MTSESVPRAVASEAFELIDGASLATARGTDTSALATARGTDTTALATARGTDPSAQVEFFSEKDLNQSPRNWFNLPERFE